MKNNVMDRFLRYVKVNTCSDESSSAKPSTAHQFDLAGMLVSEMKEMGISDAYNDRYCNVYGHIPATKGMENAPKIAFIAHLDTVSDFCDKPVNPVIHENYDGCDVYLPECRRVIKVSEFTDLKYMKGRTLITADGSTILGADDKAGIAEILTMAEYFLNHDKAHGKICIAFTPDEEIGGGAETLDLNELDADFGFTADGDIEGTIEYENFNAASARVLFTGVNVHPGSAKDIMINAAYAATEFNRMLPEKETPRNTEGYEGFYHLVNMSGTVEKAELDYIIRDHDAERFKMRKEYLLKLADEINDKYGKDTASVEIKDSYRNMLEMIRPHIHIIDHAKEAVRKAGLEPVTKPVRGGTDGAQLSFRGLPCPNLGTGGNAFHGPYEHITAEGMETAVNILINIVSGYAE